VFYSLPTSASYYPELINTILSTGASQTGSAMDTALPLSLVETGSSVQVLYTKYDVQALESVVDPNVSVGWFKGLNLRSCSHNTQTLSLYRFLRRKRIERFVNEHKCYPSTFTV
jgi:hypothetical protein